jgi:hypothetical protein
MQQPQQHADEPAYRTVREAAAGMTPVFTLQHAAAALAHTR